MKYIVTALIFASAALAQTPASDAIDALRGLNSATDVSLTFAEYSKRMIDAKVKVDKYLADAPKDDPPRETIQNTMRLYVLAGQLWSASVQGTVPADAPAEEILASPEWSACSDLAPRIAAAKTKKPWYETTTTKMTEKQRAALRAKDHLTPASHLAMDLARNPGILWKCASNALDGLKK